MKKYVHWGRIATVVIGIALAYLDVTLLTQVAESSVFASPAERAARSAAEGYKNMDARPGLAVKCFEEAVSLARGNAEYCMALGGPMARSRSVGARQPPRMNCSSRRRTPT